MIKHFDFLSFEFEAYFRPRRYRIFAFEIIIWYHGIPSSWEIENQAFSYVEAYLTNLANLNGDTRRV